MTTEPTLCSFEHRGFAALGESLFRLAKGDAVPALAMKLDNNDVVVPVHALSKLFELKAGSADAHMLSLVEQALRFVPCLRIGDPLPTEVVSGKASWEPTPAHKKLASARLQQQLVRWLRDAAAADGQATADAAESPSEAGADAVEPPVLLFEEALLAAAKALGFEGNGAAVAVRIEALADELAYFEALRERLLDRAQAWAKRLAKSWSNGPAPSATQRESLAQAMRLASVGLQQIASRFAELDGLVGDILSALSDPERPRLSLRPHRDWLYCVQLAWEPMLKTWETLPARPAEDRVARLIEEAYRFLAMRYMTVTEWQTAPLMSRTEAKESPMVWGLRSARAS